MARGRALHWGVEGAAGLGRATAPESAQRYKRRRSYSKNASFRRKSVRMTTFATTGAKKFAQRDPSSGVFAKNSPSTPQTADFGPYFVRRANFFAHRTQPRANFETNNTSAATDAGQYETVGTNARPQTATIETAITSATADAGQRETAGATARPQTATIETGNTTATEKCTKNSFFSPAKAMAVSIGARPARAKAMAVSTPRTDERAKATGVSRERFPMPAGHCGAWPGFETTHRTIHQRPSPTGVKGAGGSGGHGRASRRSAERSEAA